MYREQLCFNLLIILLWFQTCERLEEERITHLREMFSLYSNMLAAAIPQLQQVRISSDFQNLVASLFFHVKEFAHNSLTYIIFWTEDDDQVYKHQVIKWLVFFISISS